MRHLRSVKAKIASDRHLREVSETINVRARTIALVFKRVLRFDRCALVFFQPIDFLGDPRKLA